LAAAAAVAAATWPVLARAGTVKLTEVYADHQEITVAMDDTWTVPPKGTSTIITEKLTVLGTISADGAGDKGVAGGDGEGKGGGLFGTGTSAGGGAGFFGKGGPAIAFVDAGVCNVDATGGAGGKAFALPDQLKNLLGSAGGGAAANDRGGAGGGHIIIKATTVILDGTISASGLTPGHEAGYAGGGSGGVIEIHAYELTGNGKILAQGAPGAETIDVAGGGGSGGIVVLDLVKPWSKNPDVSGGSITGCALADGEPGTVVKTSPPNHCVDSDGDGFYPKICAPNGAKVDCDDSNAARFPNNPEVCDGFDNDCDGVVDDNLIATACQADQVCQDGNCVTNHMPDAGGMGDAGNGAVPDRIDFGGGCDVTPLATASGFAAVSAAIAALGLAARRRRRNARRG
jgi:hypothetical protein